jgi:predicted anti-sigma-YlaC factor YlaD
MFCDTVLDLLEPIAAGDLTPDEATRSHLASCPNCAGALEQARRVERLLESRPAPAPPSQFTTRTLARIRRDRWRREQFLDAGFNLAIATMVVGVVVAVWMIMDRSGLSAISRDLVDLFGGQLATVVRQLAPALPHYAGAIALLATALALWWWAERDVTL